MRTRAALTFLIGLWILAIVAGQAAMLRFAGTAGLPAVPAQGSLPELLFMTRQPAVVLFVHPNCPCSRSSVQELAELIERASSSALVIVVFESYSGRIDPTTSKLWTETAALNGLIRMVDQDGVMARKFGARTSGQVLAFGGNRKLLFSGGVTPARGEVGDCDGRRAVEAVIQGQLTRQPAAPVFGCAL